MGENNTTFDSIIDFLSSEMWWGQILDFMLSRCEIFRESDTYSIEEYKIYKEYCAFIEKIIDQQLCENVKLTANQLEEVILQGVENDQPQAMSIKDTLYRALDFETFRRDMVSHNERVEEEVRNVLAEKTAMESPLINNSEAYQVHQPNNVSALPSLNIQSPRNPRKNIFNRALVYQHAMKMKGPLLHPTSNVPIHSPPSFNNANIGLFKPSNMLAQSNACGLPPLKSPRPPMAKLPPLLKSPRFNN